MDYSSVVDKFFDLLKVKERDVTFYKVRRGTQVKCYVKYPVENGQYSFDNMESEAFVDWVIVNSTKNLLHSQMPDYLKKILAFVRLDTDLPEKEVFSRIGHHQGKIYFNLCDKSQRVVEIDNGGYRTIKRDSAPVLFAPTESMMAIPKPYSFMDGEVEEFDLVGTLSSLLNADRENAILIAAWLISALNPTIKCPILLFSSSYGTGKSTAGRYTKRIIGADFEQAVSPSTDINDLCAAAASRYVLNVDNISKLTQRQSDNYCQLVTGFGHSKRKLRTDNTAYNIRLQNPIIMNGVNFIPQYPDLRDRCFIVNLKKLDATMSKSEHELEERFTEVWPKILGPCLRQSLQDLLIPAAP